MPAKKKGVKNTRNPVVSINPFNVRVWRDIGGASVSRSFLDDRTIRMFASVYDAYRWVDEKKAAANKFGVNRLRVRIRLSRVPEQRSYK